MKELFELSFSPENIFPTALLLFAGLYWLVFMIGFLDLNFIDLHIEGDVDADIHVDHDVSMDKDVDVDADGNTGAGVKFLRFFNLGDVPFMVIFSFFALFFWAMTVLGNHYLGDGSIALIIGISVASFIVAAFFSKFITQPFRKVFREMSKGDKALDLRGKLCTLEVGVEGNNMGQAQLMIDDKYLQINVRSHNGKRINKGMRCLILEKSEDKHAYLVEEIDLEE